MSVNAISSKPFNTVGKDTEGRKGKLNLGLVVSSGELQITTFAMVKGI